MIGGRDLGAAIGMSCNLVRPIAPPPTDMEGSLLEEVKLEKIVQSDNDTESNYGDESQRNREFTSLLISMYRDTPELWDTSQKLYGDKNTRRTALEKITDCLKALDEGFTVHKLKRKINSLRSNFHRENKKLQKSITPGVKKKRVYRPKLWYFDDLCFIKECNNTSNVGPAAEGTTQGEAQVTEEEYPRRSLVARLGMWQKLVEERLTVGSYPSRTESEMDIVAKGWALKLNRLEAKQRRFAEKIINDVLFEAEMGTLTRNGVILSP